MHDKCRDKLNSDEFPSGPREKCRICGTFFILWDILISPLKFALDSEETSGQIWQSIFIAFPGYISYNVGMSMRK